MFVRWKRQQRRGDYAGSETIPGSEYLAVNGNIYRRARPVYETETLLSAHLVESVRIDGKPRQRTIGYLASIREHHLEPGAPYGDSHRGRFWNKAVSRLEELPISEQDKQAAIAALALKVPKM